MDKNGNIKYNMLKRIVPEPYREVGNEMIDSCTHIGECICLEPASLVLFNNLTNGF